MISPRFSATLPILAGLLAVLGAISIGVSCRTAVSRRPNVVVVSIDTLAQDRLRAFSAQAPEHPQLDAYARGAVRLANAYAAASWTLPSHGSLMTGLYPDRHGATDPRRRVADHTPRLAEQLRRGGYRTLAFTDAGFVDRRFGFGGGFERYDDWGENPAWPRMRLPRQGEPGERRKQVFDRAVAFLRGLEPGDSPFFLFAHTFIVHDYYLKTEGHARHRDCVQGKRTCPPYVWEKLEDQYRAEIERVDASFGRLLAAVEATRSPTILVVLSDHGEGFDVARGRIHHGGRLHQDLLRVPLLISGPGIEPRVVSDPVSLVDVMPTLLELVGLPRPAGLDGRSFAAALQGGRLQPRPLYAMEHFYSWQHGKREEAVDVQPSPLALAIIADDRWYIGGKSGEELYDMKADPAQHAGLGADPSRAALGRLVAERLQVHKPEEESQIDEARREQLRSMGYIE